jgi:hypothetical protein
MIPQAFGAALVKRNNVKPELQEGVRARLNFYGPSLVSQAMRCLSGSSGARSRVEKFVSFIAGLGDFPDLKDNLIKTWLPSAFEFNQRKRSFDPF